MTEIKLKLIEIVDEDSWECDCSQCKHGKSVWDLEKTEKLSKIAKERYFTKKEVYGIEGFCNRCKKIVVGYFEGGKV